MHNTLDAPLKKNKFKDSSLVSRICSYKYLYFMLIPVIVWYVIFCYMPMYGVTLAFKTFDFSKGLMGSPWVGLQHFQEIFKDGDFWIAFKNTIIISIGKLIFHFPTPIILAIVLNEITRTRFKRIYQTVFTFPHFISWVVLSGIICNIFGSDGAFNQIMQVFGKESFSPLISESSFRPMIYITHIWKEIGWDSIIYLAALSGISVELYEAAGIDGANRLQRMIHITWPGIRSTVAILLVLNVGQMMSAGASFDQIFNLYSPSVYNVADVIDTYIFRSAFMIGKDFGYMTAVGLIKSVINLTLLFIADRAVKAMGEPGIF